MRDIKRAILNNFGINIDEVNILKLYKITNVNISSQELQQAITTTKNRWISSVNGANEKFAARDSAHLKNADNYEKILRNDNLRKELFEYYNGGKKNGQAVNTQFADEYFAIVSESKNIRKKDVEFFFKYFPDQRKNKKVIVESLEKKYKLKLTNISDTDDEKEEKTTSKSQKNIIKNLFDEKTILELHNCEMLYKQAQQSDEIRRRIPEIQDDLYLFLKLNKMNKIQEFATYVRGQREKYSNMKYDFGNEFRYLMDMFNKLNTLTDKHKDVIDNFTEVKLIIKYSKLTPYMYAYSEMKEKTLNKTYGMAIQEYRFRNMSDFINTYYEPVSDNFGIINSPIKKILKRAEKDVAKNKVLNRIDEKLGLNNSARVPIWAEIIHYMAYWPIYLIYLILAGIDLFVQNTRHLGLIVFGLSFILINKFVPYMQWFKSCMDIMDIKEGSDAFKGGVLYLFNIDGLWKNCDGKIAILAIALLVGIVIFICVPVIFGLFASDFIVNFTGNFDVRGWIRTVKEIIKKLNEVSKNQFKNRRNIFIKERIASAIINIVGTILMVIFIIKLPNILGFLYYTLYSFM